jgi:hypothetical protein
VLLAEPAVVRRQRPWLVGTSCSGEQPSSPIQHSSRQPSPSLPSRATPGRTSPFSSRSDSHSLTIVSIRLVPTVTDHAGWRYGLPTRHRPAARDRRHAQAADAPCGPPARQRPQVTARFSLLTVLGVQAPEVPVRPRRQIVLVRCRVAGGSLPSVHVVLRMPSLNSSRLHGLRPRLQRPARSRRLSSSPITSERHSICSCASCARTRRGSPKDRVRPSRRTVADAYRSAGSRSHSWREMRGVDA